MNSKKTLFQTALLALTGTVLAAVTSPAALVATPVNGDIFLGFRASGGQGGSVSYLVNLGTNNQFRTIGSGAGSAVPGDTFALTSIGDIGADLVTAFGSNWATRADLFWGVFGVSTSGSSTVFGSREQIPVGVPSLVYSPLSSGDRNSTGSQISSVISQPGGFTGAESTINSTVATLQINTGNASSYNKQVATAGTSDFGTVSGWNSIEGDFGDGPAGTALDLYRLAGTTSERLGTFSISNSGSLGFTAVPEPGAPLLAAFATGMALTARRRRVTPDI